MARRWIERRSWVKGRRWSRTLSRTRIVQTAVPEAVALLADQFGWESLVYAAMIGADVFTSEAADRWTDMRSRRQEEDYYTFGEIDMKLQEMRMSLPNLPRPVAAWFQRREQVAPGQSHISGESDTGSP